MRHKFKLVSFLIVLILIFSLAYFYLFPKTGTNKPTSKPLLAYTFKNLKNTAFPVTQITLGKIVGETDNSWSQIFYYSVPKTPESKIMLKVSGLINIPKNKGNHPVIIMFRGFIPESAYKPGAGTQPSASVFAKNGFITLAPDFLGFGESASASADTFENRFQTYTTALSLLSSVKSLNTALENKFAASISANLKEVGIWGHSNGGHIALATLAISGTKMPTVLWAPVSTSFPYSILYYTDESDDQGKALRKILAGFEKLYNADDFSPSNYYAFIKAPILINQGVNDEEVPYWWSQNLQQTLKKTNTDVTLITYPNSDHNFLPSGWSSAVNISIKFYNQQFSK